MEAIKNFDEAVASNIIGNTYHDSVASVNYQPTFNPIEKIVQLYDEKVALHERMLKDKSDMVEKLEELLLKGKSQPRLLISLSAQLFTFFKQLFDYEQFEPGIAFIVF